MKLRFIGATLLLGIICTATFAQTTNTPVKSGSSYLKMVQATVQRTMPGARGMEPITQYRFLLVWRSATEPGTFFWRGNGSWMTCNIQKAHKAHTKTKDITAQYTLEMIRPGSIKKGDTLEITPMRGGKYAIPPEIPQTAVNTLFFKTTNSNWLKYPVKKIDKRPDIIMP